MNDDPQRPDIRPDTSLSLQEAAARASVHERTLRRWIKSGRLLAVKEDGQYRITVADLERANRGTPNTIRAPGTDRPDARAPEPDRPDIPEPGHRTANMPAPDSVSGIDLTPMVSLIERQARELAEYREAAAVWQERARTLEQRLLQLTAGTSEPEPAPEAPGSTESHATPVQWIRTLLRRLLGS